MAKITLPADRTFILPTKQLSSFYHIIEGTVTTSFSGGKYNLMANDVIGALECVNENYLCTYTTVTDCIFESYSYSDLNTLYDFLCSNHNFANDLLHSAITQFQTIANLLSNLNAEVPRLCQLLKLDYKLCQTYTKKYYLDFNTIPQLEMFIDYKPTLTTPSLEEKICMEYINSDVANLGIGAIISLIKDLNHTFMIYLSEFDTCTSFLKQTYELYMSEHTVDLFQMFEPILVQSNITTADTTAIQDLLYNRIQFLQKSAILDQQLVSKKLTYFEQFTHKTNQKNDQDTLFNPSMSFSKILDFSTLSTEDKVTLKKDIESYTNYATVPIDDDSITLRKALTKQYFKLYENIFFETIDKTDVPIEVLMFLSFGYLDESISGVENATILSHHVKALDQMCGNGIYTLYQWLLAIYRGEKEPSRNEFDEDYNVYLRGLVQKGDISKEEESKLLTDNKEKTRYEINNMFPTVLKMTFGRIMSYCPVFSKNQTLPNFADSFVSRDKILELLSSVTEVDFKVFYRETFTTLEFLNNIKYEINASYTPDIILTPCVGNRGVMWQEIEGKKRNTSARFLFPIFHIEDLESSFLHVIGEYRWEMCKRIQGARWNDVSERSLTSEYCDYLQFYKKNIELSADAKEKIKSSLLKARNNYKELFAREYMIWITSESSGSPRLNKLSRNIFFSHCTFASSIRANLKENPLYAEQLARYDIQMRQKLNKCQNIIVKYQASGKQIPLELEKEKEYLSK